MKVAIASDDGKVISSHFGRTKGFVIYEIEGNEIKKKEYIRNDFTGHARGHEGIHGLDHHSAIIDALRDCSVVISHGMGKRLYDDLVKAGIEAVITEEYDIESAIKLYLKGELSNLPELSCKGKKEGRGKE